MSELRGDWEGIGSTLWHGSANRTREQVGALLRLDTPTLSAPDLGMAICSLSMAISHGMAHCEQVAGSTVTVSVSLTHPDAELSGWIHRLVNYPGDPRKTIQQATRMLATTGPDSDVPGKVALFLLEFMCRLHDEFRGMN